MVLIHFPNYRRITTVTKTISQISRNLDTIWSIKNQITVHSRFQTSLSDFIWGRHYVIYVDGHYSGRLLNYERTLPTSIQLTVETYFQTSIYVGDLQLTWDSTASNMYPDGGPYRSIYFYQNIIIIWAWRREINYPKNSWSTHSDIFHVVGVLWNLSSSQLI